VGRDAARRDAASPEAPAARPEILRRHIMARLP
jgi:hypothetical protein